MSVLRVQEGRYWELLCDDPVCNPPEGVPFDMSHVYASGNIAATQVARSKPDGHTLLMGALTSHSINAALYGNIVPFDIDTPGSPDLVGAAIHARFALEGKPGATMRPPMSTTIASPVGRSGRTPSIRSPRTRTSARRSCALSDPPRWSVGAPVAHPAGTSRLARRTVRQTVCTVRVAGVGSASTARRRGGCRRGGERWRRAAVRPRASSGHAGWSAAWHHSLAAWLPHRRPRRAGRRTSRSSFRARNASAPTATGVLEPMDPLRARERDVR